MYFHSVWKQGEQAEDLQISEMSADRNPEAHGQHQSDLLGCPPPLGRRPIGGMPQTNLNMTYGASTKNGAPFILGQGTNGFAFTY